MTGFRLTKEWRQKMRWAVSSTATSVGLGPLAAAFEMAVDAGLVEAEATMEVPACAQQKCPWVDTSSVHFPF